MKTPLGLLPLARLPVILAFLAAVAGVARGQVVTEFPIPTTNSVPIGIAAGSDGNLWFTESDPSANKIGRITTTGVITEFTIPSAGSGAAMIAAGPDGNLWFSENTGNQIGRITTAGVITEFPVPTANSGPFGIAAGPDGNLWFTEQNVDKIGRITTAGVITEFPIPTAGSFPHGITAGPDGNLWFAELSGNIGRITTAGVVTEFPTSLASGIAAGQDGNLWFTSGNKIGRITAAGVITEFAILASNSQPNQIAAGPDGNLWFTDSPPALIGRITTAGVISEFGIPTYPSDPVGIAAGQDGNLWFTEYSGNKIGRITTAPTVPQPMAVDTHAVAGSSSDANDVLEPGETVQVAPSWNNTLTDPQTFTGAASDLSGPPGPTYTIDDSTADYGTLDAGATGDCNGGASDCYLLTVSGERPGNHWDTTFTEDLSANSITKEWTLHMGGSFTDVPTSHQFYAFIENLSHNGVTAGCGGGNYCSDSPVTRGQMAIFLLRGKFGASHRTPPASGTVFNDVPAGGFASDWIEELARLQITGGCGGGNYCPDNPVTRAQMAVFLLKSEHGSAYAPPTCTGVFGDVTCPSQFANWIEQLAAEGITGGCGNGNYCPDNPINRGQMAVFLVKTFGLQLYGPVAPRIGPANPYTVGVRQVGIPNSYHFEFQPSTIHIRVGDTIIWTLNGNHSTTGPGWDSGIGPLSFAQTFVQSGSFTYHCSAPHPGHPHYPGVVVVDP